MNAHRPASLLLVAAVLTAMLVAVGGCHHPGTDDWKFADLFDLDKGFPWQDDSPQPEVPVRVVGTWSDAVLNKEGQMPQRGFGGRLFFYGRKSNDPCLVDGQLVVYAFDENGREPTDNRPTRRYVFPADQLALHHSDSDLGTSYSFWLPWDEVGGPQTEVSLICRFEPKGGPVVVSEQTRHLLPGALHPGTMIADSRTPQLPEGIPSRPAVRQVPYTPDSPSHGMAQTASYEGQPGGQPSVAAPAPLGANRQMETTSISLPAGFHLRGGLKTVRGGPSSTSAQTVQVPSRSPVPTASPQTPVALNPSTQQPTSGVQTTGVPASRVPTGGFHTTTPSWPAVPQVPAGGYTTAASPAATGQVAPLPGGLTTTVSYRFPGQPIPAPASSDSPPSTLPAQVVPGFPAPAAVIR